MVRNLEEPQSVISLVLEVAFVAQIEKTRQMEESLGADIEAFADKVKECSVLKTKKQNMSAEEEPKAKFADDFMVFLKAIENEDLETVGRFDEKAMMDTISTMINNNGGNIRGLANAAGFNEGAFNMTGLGLEENVSMDTIVATDGPNSDGNGA